jgi:hypothetical protein
MGNIVSCCKKEKEYEEHLIRDIVCDQCQVRFLSNYEYNKHIPTCRRVYGDM